MGGCRSCDVRRTAGRRFRKRQGREERDCPGNVWTPATVRQPPIHGVFALVRRKYTVIISHSRKFVFVHIYKTGGVSIRSQLLRWARPVEKVASVWPTRFLVRKAGELMDTGLDGSRWLTGLREHDTAEAARNYLGADTFESYFSFAFVRNPWDWCVSLYEYARGRPDNHEHELASRMSFGDYIRRDIDSRPLRQVDFITAAAGGPVIVDFVGRLERIDADFDSVRRRISLPSSPVPHLNRSSRRRDYRSYYDDALADLVGSYYREDVDRFGYAFAGD
jgi:hypothetical protein